MEYQAKLNRHLSEYKRTVLGILEPGVYRHRGRDLPYEHILPTDRWKKNLLPEAEHLAVKFFMRNPGARHRYFHHLNSSQAFAMNLFLPYFSVGLDTSALLLGALRQEGNLQAWGLEEVPVAEEGTNVDAWWHTTLGLKTYCEVKLSERSFGKATNDVRHLLKLETVYKVRLSAHLDASCLEPGAFFRDYQFYRNVWQIADSPDCRLLILLPRANTRLWAHLERLLTLVTPQTAVRVSAVAIEDVLDRLTLAPELPPNLASYGAKLRDKYMPVA